MFQGLKDKHVLVTGGAKGIGRAVVNRFLMEGCAVTVVDNDIKALTVAYEASGMVIRIPLDISDEGQVWEDLSSRRFDILVNNAAITFGDDYAAIMAVNCDGTRYVTEAVLAGMKEQGHGSVVFITSVHTAMAFQGDASYDGSKGWAVSYMRARALELAPLGIRLNAVAPGAIRDAGGQRGLSDEAMEPFAKRIPCKRYGTPREIANAVAFLASDEASYITGAELRVDGGMSIKNPFQD